MVLSKIPGICRGFFVVKYKAINMVELYQRMAALFLYQQLRPCAVEYLKDQRVLNLNPVPSQIDSVIHSMLTWQRMLSQTQDEKYKGPLDPAECKVLLENEARRYRLSSASLLSQAISVLDNELVRKIVQGAGDGIWTRDILVGNEALYH